MNVLKNLNKLDWDKLSSNTGAIPLLELAFEKSPNKINWRNLSSNSGAVKLLQQNIDKIHLDILTYNPMIISFVNKISETNPEKFDSVISRVDIDSILRNSFDDSEYYNFDAISKNPGVIKLLEKQFEIDSSKIGWIFLSEHPFALDFIKKEIKKNPNNINWRLLSANTGAGSLFEKQIKKNPNKLDWNRLSANPGAIQLLEKQINSDKINWHRLSENPGAILLIQRVFEKTPDKISWKYLSENTKINELCFWDTGFTDTGVLINDYFDFYNNYKFMRIFLPKEIVLEILRKIHL